MFYTYLKNRTVWISTTLDLLNYDPEGEGLTEVGDLDKGNLVSSRMVNGQHTPAIDLDVSAALIDSSTEGHHHLFINKEMSWRQYKRLLKALRDAGIIEPYFYTVSCKRKQTLLRKPGLKKVR